MSRQKPRTRCDERQRQRHGYGRGDGRGGRRGYRRRRLVGGATANPRVCVADEGGRGSRLLLDVLQLHFPERRRDVAMHLCAPLAFISSSAGSRRDNSASYTALPTKCTISSHTERISAPARDAKAPGLHAFRPRCAQKESVATRAKFKKALFRTLNNRRRVVELVHSVHLAYGLKTRCFLK